MTDQLPRYLPDGLPEGLVDQDETTILRSLGRPTLIRFPGGDSAAPRVVSTLLHGDEPSGFQAMVRLLRGRPQLPYELYVLVGNVRAALSPPGFAVRYLDDQEDFNRVWAPPIEPTELGEAASWMLEKVRAAGPGSVVDMHNTTGDNPFYAIVTRTRPDTLNLATLFTSQLVHWELPTGTLLEQLHDACPAVAIECGLATRPEALSFALEGLRRYLTAPTPPTGEVERDPDLLSGLCRVTLRPEVQLRFGGDLSGDIDLVVAADADEFNFVPVPAGHVLGRAHADRPFPLQAIDTRGREVTDGLLTMQDGDVVLRRPATPVMMTRTAEAASKDCLLYLAVDPSRAG